jgi:hypothetical protein
VGFGAHLLLQKTTIMTMCNGDCSVIGGAVANGFPKNEPFGTTFVKNYKQMKKFCSQSTAKMVPSVAMKRNLRHLTCLYEITVFIGLRSSE